MTTSVCHGFPAAYLEPGFVEPQLLRLTLTPPPSIFPKTQCNSDAETGGWESLLSLTAPAATKDAAEYIHPLAKRSEQLLSERSLEMCTESLGCETGSDAGDEFPPGELPIRNQETARRRSIGRGGARLLPPPMPSIGGVQFRPHREGGRLVLTAVEVDSPPPCFKAERANGRLRLSFADSFEGMDVNFENLEGKTGNSEFLASS